jgi:hypothetical protein
MRHRALLLLLLPLISGFSLGQKVNSGQELLSLFRKAVVEDNFGDMKSLVEANRDHVDNAFFQQEIQWCANSVNDSAAEAAAQAMLVLERFAQMHKLYGARSAWLENRVAWLGRLTPEQRKAKVDVWNLNSDAYSAYDRVIKTRTTEHVPAALELYAKLHDAAVVATDDYWIANACLATGKVCELQPDWFAATYWFKRGASYASKGSHAAEKIASMNMEGSIKTSATTGKLRSELINVDLPLEESRKTYDAAIASGVSPEGATDPAVSEALKGMPPAPNKFPAGTDMGWVDHTGFQVGYLKSEPNWEPPYVTAGNHWMYWPGVELEKGATKETPLLPGATSMENDRGDIIIHPGGKGKGKPIELKLKDRPSIAEFKNISYLDGSKGTIHHFIMRRPSSFNFMGGSYRTSGTATVILVRGASYVKGNLLGSPIEVHDTSGNGSFNDFGMDTVLIGKGKDLKIRPLSKYVELGGLLYEFKVDANGLGIKTKAYDGPLAAIKFDYKANKKPISMIMQGASAESNYMVNLMEALDKPIWVVPTQFKFYSGYFAEGSGEKRITITVSTGRSGMVDVQAGSLETISMGGTGKGFSLECKPETRVEKGEASIFIPGTSIQVFGSGGEEYSKLMYGPVIPEVQIRKGAEGKSSIREKMRPRDRSQLDVGTSTFPADFMIDKPWKGEFQVKLVADYAPLGKMESEWISGS